MTITNQTRIRARRLRRDGKTQQAIATELGVSKTSIKRWTASKQQRQTAKTPRRSPRWRQRLPRARFVDYLFNYPAHVVVGFLAGAGMLLGGEFIGVWIPFALLLGLVIVRQTVEFVRRNDTPGRDLGQTMAGLILGYAFGAWLLADWRDVDWLPQVLQVI